MITQEQIDKETGEFVAEFLARFGAIPADRIERIIEGKRQQIMRREDRRDRTQIAWDSRPWSRASRELHKRLWAAAA